MESASVVLRSSLSRYLIGKSKYPPHRTIPEASGHGTAGNPLAGYGDGSEEKIDEASAASQIRAREAAIAREADAGSVSPS